MPSSRLAMSLETEPRSNTTEPSESVPSVDQRTVFKYVVHARDTTASQLTTYLTSAHLAVAPAMYSSDSASPTTSYVVCIALLQNPTIPENCPKGYVLWDMIFFLRDSQGSPSASQGDDIAVSQIFPKRPL